MSDMLYVAEDRDKPGTAWAMCVDSEYHREEVADTLRGWVMDGGIVRYVERDVALEMIGKWHRNTTAESASPATQTN